MNNRVVITDEQKKGLFLHYKMKKEPYTDYVFCEGAKWYFFRTNFSGKWEVQSFGDRTIFDQSSVSEEYMTFFNQYTYEELVELILVDLL